MTSPRRLCLLLLPLLLLAGACGGSDDSGGSAQGSTKKAECVYGAGQGQAARKVDPPPGTPVTKKSTRVTISTNQGAIPITLDADITPCAVNSFLSLAKQGYFDDSPCPRLTTKGIFVLQCGDPSGTGAGGPGYTVPDELPSPDPRLTNCQDQGPATICTYPPGTLAMAKQGDPATGLPTPDTAGSQFFLVYNNTPLPEGYQVFGRMTAAGLKVVKDVAASGAKAPDANGTTAPKRAISITSVK